MVGERRRPNVFTLAEGVTFHDGSPFSAQDVVWTFDRLRNPESGFPTADLYANIASVEATGDLEVTFTLNEPNPFFLFDLSDNHALVLKAETEDPTAFNGTGPFKVVEYSPEDRLVLEANESYFVEGQPSLAGMELVFFNDQTAMVDACVAGGPGDGPVHRSVPSLEGSGCYPAAGANQPVRSGAAALGSSTWE
jgi:peptide/nickel transport system substrate-binding protein